MSCACRREIEWTLKAANTTDLPIPVRHQFVDRLDRLREKLEGCSACGPAANEEITNRDEAVADRS